MPSFNLSDFFNSTLVLWLTYPTIFGLFAVACLFAAWKLFTHAWLEDDEQPATPLPYEPRSFQKPAAKGFQRSATVVSMQARKRDGNEAA